MDSTRKTFSWQDLQSLVSENLRQEIIKYGHADVYEVEWVEPGTLYSLNRLDLAAKVEYATWMLSSLGEEVQGELEIARYHRAKYLSVVNAINGWNEDDGSNKCGPQDFIKQFDDLIKNFQSTGWDIGKGIVPLGANGTPIDGSHRVAISIALGLNVPVIRTRVTDIQITAENLRGFGLKEQDLSHWMYETLSNSARYGVYVIYPVAAFGEDIFLEEVAKRQGSVAFSKSLTPSFNFMLNYVNDVYAGEEWESGFGGAASVENKTRAVFGGGGAVIRLNVVEFCNENTKEIKDSIRNKLGMGNDSVHTADTRMDARRMSAPFFNDATRSLFEKAPYPKLRSYAKLMAEANDRGIIVGSAVLGAYGLRAVRDVDLVGSHLNYHGINLCDPANIMYLRGRKMLSPQATVQFKKRRGEPHDILDVDLIEKGINQGSGLKIDGDATLPSQFNPILALRLFKTYAAKCRRLWWGSGQTQGLKFSVYDQFTVSGGNFLTILLASHRIGLADLGHLGMLYALFSAAATIFITGIFHPASVQIHEGRNRALYFSSMFSMGCIVALGFGMLAPFVGLFSVSAAFDYSLALNAFLFVICLSLGDFTRRYFYLVGKEDVAFISSIFVYVPRLLLICVCRDLESILIVSYLFAFPLAVIFLWETTARQLSTKQSPRSIIKLAIENKWFFLAGPASASHSHYVLFLMVSLKDAASGGILVAIRGLAQAANVLMELIETRVSVRAGALKQANDSSFSVYMKGVLLTGVMTWGMGLLVVYFFGDTLVSLIYPATISGVMPIFLLIWISQLFVFLFKREYLIARNTDNIHTVSISYTISVVLSLPFGIWAMGYFGVMGAAMTILGSYILLYLVQGVFNRCAARPLAVGGVKWR